MREKAVLDYGAGTATYATHTGDPMFLPLNEANKWNDPLDDYINDPKLTDKAWFDLGDIIPLWIAADSVNGKLYALPTEGEATIHVYNREFYEKKGLKPPATMDEFKENRQAAEQDRRQGRGGRRCAASAGPGRTCTSGPRYF